MTSDAIQRTRGQSVPVACLLGFLLLGCAGGVGDEGAVAVESDPMLVAVDPDAGASDREIAVEVIWKEAVSGARDRADTRRELKRLLWRRGGVAGTRARVAIVRALASDETPDGAADSQALFALMLPTESSWSVLTAMCEEIGSRGWTRATSSLVRSYAREVESPSDDERPERDALLRLHPGEDLEEIVFGVFMGKDADRTVALSDSLRDEFREKERRAAWALLARIDADGDQRRRFLDGGERPTNDELVATLRAGSTELGVVPLTESELVWLQQLRSHREWWGSTAVIIGELDPGQREGLELRHLEPIRWAGERRPDWLDASQSQLLNEFGERLAGRRHVPRSIDNRFRNGSESIDDWNESLSWADVLSLLVIDEMLRDPQVAAALHEQAATDRADTSTEHGGVLVFDASVPRARPYPPRPAQRVGDTRFVAPAEMFSEQPFAVVHYHFHANKTRNRSFAGPGPVDCDYADMHNRNCLVLTSLDIDELNIDYYRRGGATIDLGVSTPGGINGEN